MEAYPHMWEVNTSLAKLIADYSDLEDGARVDEASLPPKLREYSSAVDDMRFFLNNLYHSWFYIPMVCQMMHNVRR